jgi:hypothetical protein
MTPEEILRKRREQTQAAANTSVPADTVTVANPISSVVRISG